jgi:hypothetical protein
MSSRIAVAAALALSALVAILCFSPAAAAAADPRPTSYLGLEGNIGGRALSIGELAALIAIGFIPALVMIARERRN